MRGRVISLFVVKLFLKEFLKDAVAARFSLGVRLLTIWTIVVGWILVPYLSPGATVTRRRADTAGEADINCHANILDWKNSVDGTLNPVKDGRASFMLVDDSSDGLRDEEADNGGITTLDDKNNAKSGNQTDAYRAAQYDNNDVVGGVPAGVVNKNGTLDDVKAVVSFSPTNTGLPLNPAFVGLSYEKVSLTKKFFTSNNVPLVKLFSQIGPAVLRIGGGTVDTTCWGGLSNLIPITASEVDAFAGFMKALPTNWSVIYGINFSVNNPTNCAAEAAYVAKALGPRLLGFEIGNEPEAYPWNGIRPDNFKFSDFISQWRPLAAAILHSVPGWAVTNGGNGWTLVGPASGGNTNYTISFARDEAGVASLLTQHYYRADGKKPIATMQLLLHPDPKLPATVSKVVSAARAAKLTLGFREDECGSYSHGGVPGVSDAYGAALWSLDFMFTVALNGGQGINFHGGGRSPYTPLMNTGTTVQQVRPEFYGMKMFSLLPRGNVVPATIKLASNINFTAYGVRQVDGAVSVLLNNKDTNDTVAASVNLGPNVVDAQLIELTGPSLASTNGYMLGGGTIKPDGSWNGGVQAMLPAMDGRLKVYVPPISAILLKPVVVRSENTQSANGNGK